MSVQNHIHLDTVLGGAPENAPTLKWTITDHAIIPMIALNVEYTRTMQLREQVLKVSGSPLVKIGYSYKIFIFNEDPGTTKTQLETLIGMMGKRVYVCDINHADDGDDHDADVKVYLFGKIDSLSPQDKLLRYYEVSVTLHPVN